MRLLPLAGAVLIAGCGSTQARVLQRPTRPLADFGALEIREAGLRMRHVLKGDWEVDARKDAAALTVELREALGDFRGRGGEPLALETRIVRYEAEYSDPKLWGGGGGIVRATMIVEADLLDAAGAPVARIEATGESESRGWSIASLKAARRRCVEAIGKFVREGN